MSKLRTVLQKRLRVKTGSLYDERDETHRCLKDLPLLSSVLEVDPLQSCRIDATRLVLEWRSRDRASVVDENGIELHELSKKLLEEFSNRAINVALAHDIGEYVRRNCSREYLI